jgi:hypothetical protein
MVWLRTEAEAPSPERVTEHDPPEQETLSEVTLQAATAASRSPPARTVAARRARWVVGVMAGA